LTKPRNGFFRRLKPALESKGNLIPGLRSLRELTQGYHLTPLRGLLIETLIGSVSIVRQVIWAETNMIRFRISLELHRFNLFSAEQDGLRDAMHSVHDCAACRKNDRE